MLWLHLDPIPIVVCGRILPFSGAWAGPWKDTEEGASKEEGVWTRCVTSPIRLLGQLFGLKGLLRTDSVAIFLRFQNHFEPPGGVGGEL
jgi:hypothetical protein